MAAKKSRSPATSGTKKTKKKAAKKKAAAKSGTTSSVKAKSTAASSAAKRAPKSPTTTGTSASKKKSATSKAAKASATKKAAKKTTRKKAQASRPAAATAKPAEEKKATDSPKPKTSRRKTAKTRPQPAIVAPVQRPESIIPEEPPTEEQLKKVKTGLSKADLENYRTVLQEHRAEIVGDVAAVTEDQNNRGGNLSNLPFHMADVGSDNFEQEFTMGLLESEKKLLAEIEDALIRMDKGYYGVCVETGKPIARARLDAKPWAKYCIEVVREKERRGLI
ncbi:MAG: TraR/DksA family transcriptional regulator [Phycisphaeraceae bacterium]|nr:TraR/DksA family transcriptional regulator [Phycisphaeraceae bacterium]